MLIFANIQVSNEDGMGDRVDLNVVMVDTGSAHTVLPRTLLESLRVYPIDFDKVKYADGSKEVLLRGQLRIRIKGFEPTWVCPVYFANTEPYLIGASTLENFGLMVDPVQCKLVREPPTKARPF